MFYVKLYFVVSFVEFRVQHVKQSKITPCELVKIVQRLMYNLSMSQGILGWL